MNFFIFSLKNPTIYFINKKGVIQVRPELPLLKDEL